MEETHDIAGLTLSSGEKTAVVSEQAFRLLYEATSRPLWGYAYHVCGRADVADDILQETFCRFLSRKPPVMDELQTRSYLFRIATNLLHDRRRGRLDEPAPQASEDGLAPDLDVEAHLDMRSAMRQMKARERELLWLAYVEGMKHTEIAASLGLSALSIRSLLFRARQKAAGLLHPRKVEP